MNNSNNYKIRIFKYITKFKIIIGNILKLIIKDKNTNCYYYSVIIIYQFIYVRLINK